AGLPSEADEEYADVRIIEGVGLAGSKLTMDRAVHNMMNHAGVGLVDAFRMASLNPARLLGIDHQVGSIEAGKVANLIVADEELNIDKVMFRGSFVDDL